MDTTLEHLADLVGRMRSSQKEYFKSRSPEVLAECKLLEREVDALLVRLKDKQERLF